jgi:hypothetical protein
MNQRSMAADSELNVQTDDHLKAKELRLRVWGALTGRDEIATGGDGTQDAIGPAYEKWKSLMEDNLRRSSKRDLISNVSGYLVPFIDDRAVNFRHG